MEDLKSQWEMVVQPRDWQPQATLATLQLEGPREDEVVQDPLDRDAGRILEAHHT